ncbi:endonuclease/exonuclease/phosphatase family protein [Roseibium aggregatum]|uniref:Endonuclease/exonuclease/phosphatase family protein n=1 Tax=Roseibium aggregatum TaxID=187304 RepID=A0A939J4I0_9HYPH|nr:endonuclease/exonuclease/phosphatase family protein [Roseibium aggregatum]MBN9673603.1 endonuclease/exonuclease/phosphatase family protein [Roseibium aggregatum]
MPFSTSRSNRPLLVSCFSLVCWLSCLGAVTAGALGLSAFVASDYWIADNMSFFLKQFLATGLIGSLAGVLGLIVQHRWHRLYKALCTLGFLFLVVLAGLTGSRTLANTVALSQSDNGGRPIKIVSINIERLFLADPVLKAFLQKENPDIVVLQEAAWWFQKQRWERYELPYGNAGVAGFPQYLKVGELGGLVVYSRYPILSEESRIVKGIPQPGISVYHDVDREVLSLTLDTGKAPLHLIAVHPDSPRSQDRWTSKRAYLDELDKTIAQAKSDHGGNVIAIGDWNSSPWSERFQRTLTANNVQTAYPDGWPHNTRFFFDYRLLTILGAPVDQFVVSPDLAVAGVSLGPDIGSDHVPLIVEIDPTAPRIEPAGRDE